MIRHLLALTLLASPAMGATIGPEDTRTIVIQNDDGGYVKDYINKYNVYERQGVRVKVLGNCWSACAYVLRVPTACAGPNAWFHFHQAHFRNGAKLKPHQIRYYTNLYPAKARALFPKRGLPVRGWHTIKGTALLPPC